MESNCAAAFLGPKTGLGAVFVAGLQRAGRLRPHFVMGDPKDRDRQDEKPEES